MDRQLGQGVLRIFPLEIDLPEYFQKNDSRSPTAHVGAHLRELQPPRLPANHPSAQPVPIPWFSKRVQELISEHRSRQGFLRIFPLPEALQRRAALQNLTGPTANDDMLRVWLRERCLTDPSWC